MLYVFVIKIAAGVEAVSLSRTFSVPVRSVCAVIIVRDCLFVFNKSCFGLFMLLLQLFSGFIS